MNNERLNAQVIKVNKKWYQLTFRDIRRRLEWKFREYVREIAREEAKYYSDNTLLRLGTCTYENGKLVLIDLSGVKNPHDHRPYRS